MQLLDHPGIGRGGDEQVVDRLAGRDLAAVPARQDDRQQAEFPGRLEPGQHAGAVAVGADPQGDVSRVGEETDLVSEDRGYAVPLGDAGDGRYVGGQRGGRQRALADDDGVDEFHRDVLRVRAGSAGTEDDELAAAVKPHGHGMARVRDSVRLLGQRVRGFGP